MKGPEVIGRFEHFNQLEVLLAACLYASILPASYEQCVVLDLDMLEMILHRRWQFLQAAL